MLLCYITISNALVLCKHYNVYCCKYYNVDILLFYITTSNNWCSCGHYNVSFATVLHYNLQGHNTAVNITMFDMPLFTSQLVPPITTSNDWYSCRHYNVLLTTILHYNLHGHNTVAKITIAMPFSCVTHVTLLKHYNALASCGVAIGGYIAMLYYCYCRPYRNFLT